MQLKVVLYNTWLQEKPLWCSQLSQSARTLFYQFGFGLNYVTLAVCLQIKYTFDLYEFTFFWHFLDVSCVHFF